MKHLFFIMVSFLVMGPSAFAQEEAVTQSFDGKFETAVAVGARIDAYGAHCEKNTHLGAAMIERARKENVVEPEDGDLQVIRDTVYDETTKELQERAVDCKDIGFLLEKLDLMKMMKKTVAALNGEEVHEVIENRANNPL